jgi:beta-xylosidase
MKSTNLVDWEIIGYVYDVLDDSDHMTLQNGKHDYGRGSWASCLRYHDGTFYIAFVAYNTGKTYIFQTEDIENGAWRKYTINGIYHDMSIIFDDDRVFMVYGAGTIKIIELTADATAIKQGGMSKTIIENADPTGGTGLAEGAHIYKLNG